MPCEKKMKALMESGDSAGALTVLESTSTLNVRMINMAFTAMLATGQSVEAAAVHAMQLCTSKGFTKTTSLHNNILAAFSHQGPPEAVISWLARMRDSGLEIDRQAYNIKLKAHLAMGDLNAAVKLLGCMMRNSPGGPPPPDAVSFNTVLTALAQASQPSKAEKVLTTMLDSGLEADTRSFTGVIVAFARASQPGPAAKWLERMLQAGVQPDTTTWNAVLLAYANAGDCEGAFRLLGNFESHAKVPSCPFELVPSPSPPGGSRCCKRATRCRGVDPCTLAGRMSECQARRALVQLAALCVCKGWPARPGGRRVLPNGEAGHHAGRCLLHHTHLRPRSRR